MGPLSGISCVPADKRTGCIAVGEQAHRYRGGYRGLILRSEDGGKNWTSRPAPSGVGYLLYVACSTPSFCLADGDSLARSPQYVVITSTDGGARWVRDDIPAGLSHYVVAGPISCVAKECWIEGESHRLLFTPDGGKSFSTQALPAAVCGGCEQTSVANVTFVNASVGYATGNAGTVGLDETSAEGIVWKTTDGGAHWTMVTLGTNSVLAIACVDPTSCWAASTTGPFASETGTMYGTADGGGHWSRQPLPRFRGFFNDLRCVHAAGEDHCFAVGENPDENGPIIVASADGGGQWSLDREPKGTGPLNQATFVGSGGRAVGFEENGRANGIVLAS